MDDPHLPGAHRKGLAAGDLGDSGATECLDDGVIGHWWVTPPSHHVGAAFFYPQCASGSVAPRSTSNGHLKLNDQGPLTASLHAYARGSVCAEAMVANTFGAYRPASPQSPHQLTAVSKHRMIIWIADYLGGLSHAGQRFRAREACHFGGEPQARCRAPSEE